MSGAVVIGSGFGGLAAAVRLRAKGYDVRVLEALEQPGGRARVFRQDGFTFDAGPTVITAPYLIAELFERVGRDPRDYSACHHLAHRVRGDAQLAIAALRYESARREFAACEVVFSASNLQLPAPNAQQTWVCKTTRHLVLFTREREALEFRPV